jgi:hypothetical protein
MRALAAQLVIAAGLVAARCVHAEPAHDALDERNATADQLFEDGRMLFKVHRYEEACARFAQSDALRHTFGTFANLGDCEQRNGHLGLAWQRYDDAARAAERDGADDKAQWARVRAANIGRDLCTVVVEISGSNPGALTVAIADHVVVAATKLPSWMALVDPGDVDVDITDPAAGTHVRRKLACAAAREVATVVVSAEDVTGVAAAAVAVATAGDSPQRRSAEVNLGVGYFPQQVGTTLAFGATVGGWAWSQTAIDWRIAGGGFLAEQITGREPGVIAFLGPSLRHAPVPALWLAAGAGVTAGWWNEGMRMTGALRPGFDLRACYWFTGAFNVSLEGFGFLDDTPSFGPISLLLGTRLR